MKAKKARKILNNYLACHELPIYDVVISTRVKQDENGNKLYIDYTFRGLIKIAYKL